MCRILSLSIFALALTFSVQAAEPFKASDIRIDGLKRVSSGSIFDVLAIQESHLDLDASGPLLLGSVIICMCMLFTRAVRKLLGVYWSLLRTP